MSEINITPLTDIFLVLLIIFMVSSAAMVESGAKISLPEVDSTAAQFSTCLVQIRSASRGPTRPRSTPTVVSKSTKR